jgi:hypothetical protein
LSQEEVNGLLCWLQEYVDDEWDRQMKEDAKSGKLNKLVQQARADIAAKQVKNLNEILNDS